MVTLLLIGIAVGVSLLSGVVLGRAPKQRPNQLYSLAMLTQVLAVIGGLLVQPALNAPSLGAFWLIMTGVLFDLTLVWLLARMYMPSWWEARPAPIAFISLPYVLIGMVALLDLLTGQGWILRARAGDSVLELGGPWQPVLLQGLVLSSILMMVLLGVTAWQRPRERWAVLALLAAVLLRIATPPLVAFWQDQIGPNWILLVYFAQLPLVAVLAVVVLRSRLFQSRRAAIERALGELDEGVAVLPAAGPPIYANQKVGELLGSSSPRALIQDLMAEPDNEWLRFALAGNHTITQDIADPQKPGRFLNLTISGVPDVQGDRGYLILVKDVTQGHEQEQRLAAQRADLEATVAALQARTAERETLAATVRGLTLPVVPVLPRVLVMPVIGDLDELRSLELQTTLLGEVQAQRAKVVVLDVTGVSLLNDAAAQGLLAAMQGAQLLGAQVVLVGIKPQVAEALVLGNLSFEGVTTYRDLQTAVSYLLHGGLALPVVRPVEI